MEGEPGSGTLNAEGKSGAESSRKGRGRKRLAKVDSNELLRELKGWGDLENLEEKIRNFNLAGVIDQFHRTKEETSQHCKDLCKFVFDNSKLAGSSMVDIFSKDLWGSLPADWREELEELQEEEVSNLSTGELDKKWKSASLREFVRSSYTLDLDRKNAVNAAEMLRCKLPLIAMSEKKAHEVEVLSLVVTKLASQFEISWTIDLGSGKGYLSEALAIGCGLKVLGIDASAVNTNGALKRQSLVTRLTGRRQREEEEEGKVAGSEQKKNGDRGIFIPVTGRMQLEDADSFLTFLGDKSGQNFNEDDKLMLVGLHTCGDLASTALRAFLKWRNVKCLCTVGCCYNLLSERYRPPEDEDSALNEPGQDFGFPLSSFVREHVERVKEEGGEMRAVLGRNVFNLAANTNQRVPHGPLHDSEVNNMFRAAFQVLWIQKLKALAPAHLQHDKVVVGKIASKSKDFEDYCMRALSRLDIDPSSLSKLEIEECYANCLARLHEFRRLGALRAILARCIESMVLIDRLCFLQEEDQETRAAIVPLFDPSLSPRSFAIIAHRVEKA